MNSSYWIVPRKWDCPSYKAVKLIECSYNSQFPQPDHYKFHFKLDHLTKKITSALAYGCYLPSSHPKFNQLWISAPTSHEITSSSPQSPSRLVTVLVMHGRTRLITLYGTRKRLVIQMNKWRVTLIVSISLTVQKLINGPISCVIDRGVCTFILARVPAQCGQFDQL